MEPDDDTTLEPEVDDKTEEESSALTFLRQPTRSGRQPKINPKYL